jgi:hypothetical protein
MGLQNFFQVLLVGFLPCVSPFLRTHFNLLINARKDMFLKNIMDVALQCLILRTKFIKAVAVDIERVLKPLVEIYLSIDLVPHLFSEERRVGTPAL